MNKLDREVLEVGALFEGRLPPAVLVDAMEDVQFNEAGLALETLCQKIAEYGVKITRSEYDRLRSRADFKYPDSSVLRHLPKQVVE